MISNKLQRLLVYKYTVIRNSNCTLFMPPICWHIVDTAQLAQSVEHEPLNLRVVGSSFHFYSTITFASFCMLTLRSSSYK